MTPAEVTASIRAESAALEHAASIVYELWGRLELLDPSVMSQAEVDLRITLVHGLWAQLDELGVDLNLPDLKTLVYAHVATHTSDGEPRTELTPPGGIPLPPSPPSEQPSSGADAAQSTPAGEEPSVGTPATPLPAPLDPTEED